MEILTETTKEKMRKFSPIVLRYGLALVILWFGSQQLLNTEMWIGLIPEWITNMTGLSAEFLVRFNGIFEVVFGTLLLLGICTRFTALLLSLHLLHITFVVGYNGVGVRDFGLSLAMISVFLHGTDAWSLDRCLPKKV